MRPASIISRLQTRASSIRPLAYKQDKSAQHCHGVVQGKQARTASSFLKLILQVEPATKYEEVSKESTWWTNFGKSLAVVGLAAALVLSNTSPAEAARSGGRMGGRSGFSRGTSSFSRSTGSTSGFHSSPAPSPYTSSHSYSPSFSSGYSRNMNVFVPVSPVGVSYGYGLDDVVGVLALIFLVIAAVVMLRGYMKPVGGSEYVGSREVTLAKVQVGLLGLAGRLKSDLNGLALKADTNNPQGLQFLLQEAVVALLRNPDYCVYGFTGASVTQDATKAEQRFLEESMSERSKFEQETLVNVGGMRRQAGLQGNADGEEKNELIVVTIVVAAEGRLALPKIKTMEDLKQALSMLGGVPARQLMGVEILWTPQADGDYLTQDECLREYPKLVPL